MLKSTVSRRDRLKSGTALATTTALPSWSFASGFIAYAAQSGGGPADPPLVEQVGSRQYFSKGDIRKTYENFLFARAIQAYMMTIPVLNTIGMRDGSEATFGRGYNTLIPAALYWAITAYNPIDGTMPETSQPFPSRNAFDPVKVNSEAPSISTSVRPSPQLYLMKTGYRYCPIMVSSSPSVSMALEHLSTIRHGSPTIL